MSFTTTMGTAKTSSAMMPDGGSQEEAGIEERNIWVGLWIFNIF